jgi:hypothetical protein
MSIRAGSTLRNQHVLRPPRGDEGDSDCTWRRGVVASYRCCGMHAARATASLRVGLEWVGLDRRVFSA